MPRKVKNLDQLDANRHLMGTVPDQEIAEQTGTTASIVGRYRRKYGIPAYRGYKFRDDKGASKRKPRGGDKVPRKSKIGPHRDQLGEIPDQEIAARAGVSLQAVRMYRRRHGIALQPHARLKPGRKPKVKPTESRGAPASKVGKKNVRRRRSKLDPYWDVLGTVPDAEIASMAGVTAQNVRAFRVRHKIPADWRTERKAAAKPKPKPKPKAKVERAAPAVAAKTVGGAQRRQVATNGVMRGFSVSVSGREDKDDYVVMAGNITQAVTQAVKMIRVRHPGAMVTGVYHLGEVIA